jgi:hypothetical protein
MSAGLFSDSCAGGFMKLIPLNELASVIRSKNAGPHVLTLDVLFGRQSDYLRLKQMGFFSSDRVAAAYGISADQVLKVVYFDPAWAVKINLMRPLASGDVGDSDVYGAQQHAPLLTWMVPNA